MTDKPEFKREHRYIVIKRSHLDPGQETRLMAFLDGVLRVEPVECVVVEHDWPEYEPVWQMIEARVMGADPVPPAGGEPVIYALSRYNDSGGFSPSMVPRETLPEPETREGYVTEEDHHGHVTRLQAEVERLGSIGRGQRKTIDNVQLQVERLQSELTKARELLDKTLRTPYAAQKAIRQYLSNQSAPADKPTRVERVEQLNQEIATLLAQDDHE